MTPARIIRTMNANPDRVRVTTGKTRMLGWSSDDLPAGIRLAAGRRLIFTAKRRISTVPVMNSGSAMKTSETPEIT